MLQLFFKLVSISYVSRLSIYVKSIFFQKMTTFFQARPLFSKRSVRADPTLPASCLLLQRPAAWCQCHGPVSAQGGAVTGRHGDRRSHHFSSCTAQLGGPAQALKVLQFVMMTLKISVFRIPVFISCSIIRNVLCFNQTSSSDDVAQLPDIGVSGPKDSPPPLQSESADVEDQLPMTKRKKGHRRPRIAIMWGRNHGRGLGCDKAADTHRVQFR